MVIISSRLGRDRSFKERFVGVFNSIPHNLLLRLPKNFQRIKSWQIINLEDLAGILGAVIFLFCAVL